MTVEVIAAIGLSEEATIVCVLAVVLYALAALAFDRYMSARPSAELLKGYARTLVERAPPELKDEARAVEARCLTAAGPQKIRDLHSSKILAGWRDAHAFEQRLVAHPQVETSLAQLISAGGALRRISGREAKDLLTEIDAVIANLRKPQPAATGDGQVKALLTEALRVLHDERDKAYENEAGTESKALALTMVGLLLLLVAGVALHREALMLLGALGGFISRMFRVLKRRPSVSDYGASWATIMLAPVAGALAGWAGVAVLGVLAELDVLDERFLRAWETPRSVLALGLAAALGASERFFDRLVSLTEGAVKPAETTAPAGEAATAPVPDPP